MEQKIKDLLLELYRENEARARALENPECSRDRAIVEQYCYNNTLDIIKRLEKTLN